MRRWVLIMVAAIGLLCAGCAGAPAGEVSPPQVGECFRLDQPAEIRAVSHTVPSVACTTEHSHETFAVGRVGSALARQAERPMPGALLLQQSALCPVDTLRQYLAAADADAVRGVEVRATFPTETAWAAGARWVRCDVVTVDQDAATGVAIGPITGDRSLADIMPTAESAALRTCYRQQPDKGGRWSREAVVVSCATSHSTQDVGAWLRASTIDDSPAGIVRACGRHVDAFLGASARRQGLIASGVMIGEDAQHVRCSVGHDSQKGDTDGVVRPGRDDDDGR